MSQESPAPGADATGESSPEISVEAMAVTDGAYALIVADFNDTDSAMQAYELLKSVEDGRTVEIEGVVVVKKDSDGKIEVQKSTDHSTRRGLGWGVVGGVVLGVIFPPSILASAVVLGAGGAAAGKLRELHNESKIADELQGAIAPGHSGIIALVSDPRAVEIQKALDKANRVVESAIDQVIADDLRAVAKDAEAAAKEAKSQT